MRIPRAFPITAPFIAGVAAGKFEELKVFGNDYETPDGTGIRDYIHVDDLAMGHVQMLKKLEYAPGLSIYNLGRGRGYSVLEVVRTFEEVTGKKFLWILLREDRVI